MKKSLMRQNNIIQIWWRQTEEPIMNLAKQKGLKVKDLGKDKIEISGNGKVVMALTLAVQKKDVKINEGHQIPKQLQMWVRCEQCSKRKMSYLKLKLKQNRWSQLLIKKKLTFKRDGHTDVASAIRQCKTIVEDAMQSHQNYRP